MMVELIYCYACARNEWDALQKNAFFKFQNLLKCIIRFLRAQCNELISLLRAKGCELIGAGLFCVSNSKSEETNEV